MKSATKRNSQLRDRNPSLSGEIFMNAKRRFDTRKGRKCSTMSQHTTIDGIFRVKSIDAEGKRFANVSRVICDSESLQLSACLDVNTQIFPIVKKDKLRLVLFSQRASVVARKLQKCTLLLNACI